MTVKFNSLTMLREEDKNITITLFQRKIGNTMAGHLFFVLGVLFASFIFRSYTALDMINTNRSLRDGETLISAAGDFELGFFSPTGTNTSRYVGIWYSKLSAKTVVWVANRDTPLYNTLGYLNMTDQGLLVLYNSTNSAVWSSNTSKATQDPVAQLLNTGNLVVRNRNYGSSEIFWQSFDYVCDSFIPGMKLGIDLITGFQRYQSSWKTTEDPAEGDYTTSVDYNPNGYPQLVLRRGTTIRYRGGSWNGIALTGRNVQNLNDIDLQQIEFIYNDTEISFVHKIQNSSTVTRVVLNPSGTLQRQIWNEEVQDWDIFGGMQPDPCEAYALCGKYGICNVQKSPVCGCLDGFIENSSNQSEGCVRRMPLNCSDADRFLKYERVKLPETSTSWFNESIDLKECKHICLQNCSCTAYANLDIRGSGCLLWFNELMDIRLISDGGQDLYLRLAASEIDDARNKGSLANKKLVAIIVSLAVTVLMVTLGIIIYGRRRYRRENERKENLELPLFDLNTIVAATNNFSSRNKLGEGGFGPVYKGVLVDGQEIAVKRLSKSSSQGLNEFKNEVILISKLQHRNLVKLLGCCIHGDEKILIYEYMPNKSLDSFIFDQTRGKLLDWNERFLIVNGIARGLMYLHQDSRLKIIHRDLKTSNVLLDKQLNPKISDFGLARTFGIDQSHAKTNRVVGTYGYMSPEYAVDGLFSVKSDIFSFGVLVLEIISGKKNRGFRHPDHDLNLLGHAWTLCTEGREMELLDECFKESCINSEVIRCIRVALLCVQQRPEDRPTMSSVVVMLTNEIQLPAPKLPGFFMGRNPLATTDSSSNTKESHSANTITITLPEGR